MSFSDIISASSLNEPRGHDRSMALQDFFTKIDLPEYTYMFVTAGVFPRKIVNVSDSRRKLEFFRL